MAYDVVLLVADVADGWKAGKQRGEHKDKRAEKNKKRDSSCHIQ